MGFLKSRNLQILGCQKPFPYLGRLQQAFVCLRIPRWLDLLAWGRLWLRGIVDIAIGDGGTVGKAAVVSGVNQFGPVCFGIVVVGVKEGAVLLGVLRGKSAYFCARGTGLLEKSL